MAHIVGVPHFAEVPEAWKRPFGPYVKAPEEFGENWYKVNPFTGPEPWKRVFTEIEALPEGFEATFGPRPVSEDFRDEVNPSLAFRVSTQLWEQDLKYFHSAGAPAWATTKELTLAKDVLAAWNLGEPRFYNGRYGFMARFPLAIPYISFEASAWGTIKRTQYEVAAYQIQAIHEGFTFKQLHPFVPPGVSIRA